VAVFPSSGTGMQHTHLLSEFLDILHTLSSCSVKAHWKASNTDITLYRVTQEERSIFWEVIVSAILRKKSLY
jgi:hypothetical protein